MKHLLALPLLIALGGAPAFAQEFKAGDIVIDKAWSRATPKGAEVGAGYLTIHNNGATPERLTGGTADFANVEVHEMTMEGGVMKMRELKDGLAIPAHGTVTLAPGGYHLMFTGLKTPLATGEAVKATLELRACRRHSRRVRRAPRRRFRRRGGKKDDMKGMKM